MGLGGIASWFLVCGEGRAVSRVQAGGVAYRLPTLWWRWMQGACPLPCFYSWPLVFFPSSSEVAPGSFWSLCILLSRICPSCVGAHCYFWPFTVFFFFFSFGLRREVQALHQCGKGSPVPACFSMMTKIKITKKTSAIRAQKLLWIGSCKSKIKLLIEERNSRW